MAQMLLEKPLEATGDGSRDERYSELEGHLRSIRDRIKPEMERIVNEYEADPVLIEAILNGIPQEGSYHRGSLISATSYEFGSKSPPRLSAAGELFYWATAWLDDVADQNTFRQETQSMRQGIGDVPSIYASNALYGIVMQSITDQFRDEPEKLADIMKYLSLNFHVINRGQMNDMLMARKPLHEVSIDDYINLVEETTGVDVGANLAMGAVSIGDDDETIEQFFQFGKRLGTIAQIRDDVLDYCDAQDTEGKYVIGKLPFRDLETGKKRLPLLLTRDLDLKTLPAEVYDKIEDEFIEPRREEARELLKSATRFHKLDDSVVPRKLLEGILDYWSNIRVFQNLNS